MFLQAGKQVTSTLNSLINYNADSSFVLECLVEEMHENKELTCYQLINHPFSEQIIFGVIGMISSADTSTSGNAAYVIGSLCDLEVVRRKVIDMVTLQQTDKNGLLESLTKLLQSKDRESRMNASGAIATLAEIIEGRSWLLRNPALDDTITRVTYLLHTDDAWTASNCSLIIARLTIDEAGCARILNRRDSRKMILRLVRALGCDKAGKGINAGFALGRLCDMPSGRKQIIMLRQRETMLNKLIEMLCHKDLGSPSLAPDEGHEILIQHLKFKLILESLMEIMKLDEDEAVWFIRTLASKRQGCLLLRDNKELKDILLKQLEREDAKDDIHDEVELTLEILKRLQKPNPVHVKVEGATTAIVSWEMISPKSGLEVTYHLFEGNSEVYSGQETSFTTQNLKPMTKYSYRMRASTEGDLSLFCNTVYIETPETVPSSPQRFQIVGRSTSLLKIAWDPPEQSNGILRGYQLVKLGNPDVCITTSNRHHVFTHLAAGTEYHLEVCAVTSAGKGEKALLTASTIDLKDHAPPVPSLMVLGRNEIFVSWEPPDGPVGRINRYEVAMNGDVVYSGIERSCSVRGLHASREYTFTVTAWTSEGKCISQPATKRTAKDSCQPTDWMSRKKFHGQSEIRTQGLRYSVHEIFSGHRVAGKNKQQKSGAQLRSKSMIGISPKSRLQVEVAERPKTTAPQNRGGSRRKSYSNSKRPPLTNSTEELENSRESVIRLRVNRRHPSTGHSTGHVADEKLSVGPTTLTVPNKIPNSEDRLAVFVNVPVKAPNSEDRLSPCVSSPPKITSTEDRLSVCVSAPTGKGVVKGSNTTNKREFQSVQGHYIPLADSLPTAINGLSVNATSTPFSQALNELKDNRHFPNKFFRPATSRTSWRPSSRPIKFLERKPNL